MIYKSVIITPSNSGEETLFSTALPNAPSSQPRLVYKSMNINPIKIAALTSFLLINPASASDSIAVPVGSQSAELRSTILVPGWGESMQSVEDRLGSPQASETIGKPAITSWVYQDMTVYFEGALVLRTVVHHKSVQPEPTSLASGNQ